MINSQSPSPQLGKSTFSSGMRRDVLWNVVQPGDPYDIRKSMIARLPGERQHFMGDNLEIVCLLQSAEIERLCQFLDDYKFRYREIERRELDRHSYEIQIKQLTEQLQGEGFLRTQNSKLKDFIKKQTQEIEQVKNSRFNVDNNLRSNYESALAQIEALINENKQLKSQKQTYILQITQYNIRIEALESARDREMRELKNKYTEENKYAIQNETRSMKSRYESEINRLEFEIKRLKEFNQAKNQQINELTSKNRALLKELQQLNSKKSKVDPSYMAQMEERFALMGQEIERLNLRIKQSTSRIDESSRNELYWKDKYNRMDDDYKSLEIRYRQINEQYTTIKIQYEKVQASAGDSAQVKKLEDQIRQLKAEIKRLEDERMSDAQRYGTLQKQYNQLEYNYTKISVIERENAEMKANQANVQELKRKVAEYETKIALLSQEIERLTSQLRNAGSQKQGYDELMSDFEEFKRKSLDKERSITQKYESEIQRKILEYESRIAKSTEESGHLFDVRLDAINREVERLNKYLKEKTDESESYKKRIRQLQNSINQKYEIDVSRQYASYETTIKELKLQNQELNRKYRDGDGSNRKVAELENKIALLSQEIERLTYTVRAKTDQVQNLQRQIRTLELRPAPSQGPDIQTSRKISMYEETQFKLTRQNEDLRRRLQEIVDFNRKIKQYEDRIKMLTQENDRLNQSLKDRVDALNRAQANLRNVSQQLEMLRRNKSEIETSWSQRIELDKMQTSRKFSNYEQSLSSIQRQYEELRRRMMDMGNDSNRKVSEYENKIVLLTQEIERLNQTYKLKINDYEIAIQNIRNQLQLAKRQNRELQVTITQRYELETSRKISVYEQNMSGLTREVEDLRRRIAEYENALRKKNDEVSQLENRYKVVSQEYEAYKFQVKTFQGQIHRNHSTYEQTISQLKRKLAEYENRIALLSQQNQRLNSQFRNSQQQLQTLRRTINELKIQITQKYEVQTSRKVNTYEQNISMLNKQLEQMRRKLLEYENMINTLNRQLQDKNRRMVEYDNKFRELQITITQKYEVEASRKITTYEQNIQNLMRELENMKMKLTEYENLRINYENQINRLKSATAQGEEFKRLLMNAEQINKNQAMELEELRRKLKQFGDIHRTVAEYENKFALLRQEHERVNMNLKTRMDEVSTLENRLRQAMQQNEELKRKLKEMEVTIVNKYQIQVNQRITTYEQTITNYKRQNQDLKRRLTQTQNKLVMMTQEIERLNSVLKQKMQQLNQLDQRGRNWQQEIQNSRRKMMQLQKSSTQRFQMQISRTVTLYEQNITNITREYEQFKRQASRRMSQYETKIAMLSQQLQRVNQALRLKTDEIDKYQRAIRELQSSTKVISTYEQNITMMTRQFEEYKLESGRKISEYERKIMQLNQELDNLRRQMKEMEIGFNQKYEIEITRRVSSYQVNFNTLKSQLSEYERRIQEFNSRIAQDENRIALLTQQVQRLNGVLKSKAEQAKHYQSEVQKYMHELENMKSNLANYYTAEIEKLNAIIRQKNEEYQLLEQKFSALQGQDGELKQLQSSYSLISKQYENSKKHLTEYEQSIRKLYSEFERLQIIINELKVERQTLFDKNHGLIKEIERLTSENKDQETQLYELRLKFSDEVSLQKRINEHMALMVVLFAEIETLRKRVKDKEEEVKEVRRSSLAPLKA